jgi:3-oxoacyl-[acyl-carrier-protein] synthase-1
VIGVPLSERNRVVGSYPVTAYSALNALGATTREVIRALDTGTSGLAPCSMDLPFETYTGAAPGPLPALPAALSAFDSRSARLAVAALDEMRPALASTIARHGSDRVALVLGTTTAGLDRTERAYHELRQTGALPTGYDMARQHAFGGLLEAVRRAAGVTGPAYVVSTACSASAKALGSAQRLLAADVVDAVLVGGVDSLCQTTLHGFHSLEILSRERCRPLSRARSGINIGEGAAYLLLERRGESHAYLLGVGESSDAHHMAAPHPEGAGAVAAMREALAQAGAEPGDVDYINAHSPGTRLNDLSESRAITSLFGAQVAVISTKGYTGHLLGAGGATEAVFAVVAVEQGWLPASLGAEPVDTTLGIHVPIARQERPCRTALSNSFAFGGNNVSVLFGREAAAV